MNNNNKINSLCVSFKWCGIYTYSGICGKIVVHEQCIALIWHLKRWSNVPANQIQLPHRHGQFSWGESWDDLKWKSKRNARFQAEESQKYHLRERKKKRKKKTTTTLKPADIKPLLIPFHKHCWHHLKGPVCNQ